MNPSIEEARARFAREVARTARWGDLDGERVTLHQCDVDCFVCGWCCGGDGLHEGRPVGRFYVVLENGAREFVPEDRSIWRKGFVGNPEGLPQWERVLEGYELHNTLDLWCCDTCFRVAAPPDWHKLSDQDAAVPRAAYMYPMCRDIAPSCAGVGDDVVGYAGDYGLCTVPQGDL